MMSLAFEKLPVPNLVKYCYSVTAYFTYPKTADCHKILHY
jgi:hypothetical protein